jgi:hypothetical protein
VVTAGRKIRLIGLTTLAVALSLSPVAVAKAQVGLTSGMAQVALVAYSAPRGAIQDVGHQQEVSRTGRVSEASVLVRMSSNTGYQLIVRGTGSTTSRIWVRAANGAFQELRAGSAVTVARGTPTAGEREVRYRIESANAADMAEQSLPVQYEIAINPTL